MRSLGNNSRSLKSYLMGSLILLIVSIYVRATHPGDRLLLFLNSSLPIFYFSLFAITTFITSFISIHSTEDKSSILTIIIGLAIFTLVHLGYYYLVLTGGLPIDRQIIVDLVVEILFFCIFPFISGTLYGGHLKKKYRE